ncbi:MAG: guanylate kinase, partial [Bacteroidetes bacterium]
GTLKSEVNKAIQANTPMLFDIDVKGALSIKKQYPDDSLLIFIEPPSIEELIQRLKKRNTENAESLAKRIQRVPMEMEQRMLFDERVVNNRLAKAIEDVDAIVMRHVG